jgi:hypothetical protein
VNTRDERPLIRGDMASDTDFIGAFERLEISGDNFHHRQHVRLAWCYLQRYELVEALARFRSALKAFANHLGVPNLYHETITFAYLLLINDRMARESVESFEEFARINEDLFAWKPSILERYYSKETLESELARKTFLFPNLRLSS